MKSLEEMSFEEALAELEKLVNELDGGQVPLEKSVALYERGNLLKKHCEKRLRDAELKINEITGAEGDSLETSPANDLLPE